MAAQKTDRAHLKTEYLTLTLFRTKIAMETRNVRKTTFQFHQFQSGIFVLNRIRLRTRCLGITAKRISCMECCLGVITTVAAVDENVLN